MITRVLGIDPSTKTGIGELSLQIEDHILNVDYVTRMVTNKLDSKTQSNHLQRVTALLADIMDITKTFKPDLIVLEGYSFSSKFVSFPLVEISAVIRWELFNRGLNFILVPPTTLKKFVTGKGNCKKDVMRLETFKRWGVEAKTDDEIDAFGLSMFGAAYMGFLKDMPKENMSVFLKNDIQIIKKL